MKTIALIAGMIAILTAAFSAVPGNLLWAMGEKPILGEEGAGRAPWAPFSPSIGRNPLYADMNKIDGKYVITKVSSRPLMFRLNDFEPRFDTKSYYCTRVGGRFVFEVTHPEKCRDDEKTFRKIKTDHWRTVAADFLTLGRNLVMGEVEENSDFDVEEYRSAIEEALNHSGLDRERVLKKYDETLTSVKQMKEISAKEYARNLKEGIVIEFPVTVEDRSGLYKNDLTAKELVYLRENEIPELGPQTFEFSAVDTGSVEKALDGIKEKYASMLDQATSYYTLAKLNSARNYSVGVDGPDKIFLKGVSRQSVPLKVTVFSRTLTDVTPPYMNENDDLRFEEDGKAVRFFNKTDRFIEIEMLAAYSGKQVTHTMLNLELAPGAFSFLDRRDGRLHLPPRGSWFNATKDSIQGQTLTFGYDVKYKVVGKNANYSLQKVHEHQVYDLIK